MKKNLWIAGIICILMATAVFQNIKQADQRALSNVKEAPKPNFLAPAFELEGMDGHSYRVGGERDKLLLINFWASWCGPCHMEAGDLQSIYNQYNDQLDLYAVNITYLDTLAGAKNFVSEYELTFPTLLDPDDVTRKKYHVDGYPTSFLINRDGIIEEAYYGMIDVKELEQTINKLLKTK